MNNQNGRSTYKALVESFRTSFENLRRIEEDVREELREEGQKFLSIRGYLKEIRSRASSTRSEYDALRHTFNISIPRIKEIATWCGISHIISIQGAPIEGGIQFYGSVFEAILDPPSLLIDLDTKVRDVLSQLLGCIDNGALDKMNEKKAMENVETGVDIFICHSSDDVEIAKRLVTLLVTSLHLTSGQIRCTSVPGYKLDPGAVTDSQLKTETISSKVFIGLISPSSLSSSYVMFELGARWGSDKLLIPLLVPGMKMSILVPPLDGINAVYGGDRSDIHAFLEKIANVLEIKIESPKVLEPVIDEIVNFRLEINDHREIGNKADSSSDVSYTSTDVDPIEDDVLIKKLISERCEQEWGTDYRMRKYCADQQYLAVEKLRIGKPEDVPDDVFLVIRSQCRNQWGSDFNMRRYCEESQINAFRDIRN